MKKQTKKIRFYNKNANITITLKDYFVAVQSMLNKQTSYNQNELQEVKGLNTKDKILNSNLSKDEQKRLAIHRNIILIDLQKDALAKVIKQQLLDIASYNIDFTSKITQLKSPKCFYIKDSDFDLLTTNTSQVLGVDKNKLSFTMIKNAIVSACKIKMMLEIKNKTKKVK